MAFRWKVPELNAGLVDPRAVMQTKGEQGMQGFVPNSAGYATAYNVDPGRMASQNMQGYNPSNVYNARTPVVGGGDGAGYMFDSTGIDSYLAGQQNRQQLLSRMSELESQLAGIDAKIAEIDRAYPGLKNGQEWEIAAKRAEIGDMSAYDNLVSRREQDGFGASGIDGELYSAEKTLGGLKSKSDEDREIVRGNIEATLRRAEEWSARTGKELPQSYYRLKRAVAASFEPSDDMNARQYGNELALKIYRNTATDDDIERGIAWAEQNPNSEAAKEILEAAKSGKYNTEEAKARAARRKKEAYDTIARLEKLPKKEQEDLWWKLSEELRKEIGKYAAWDTTGKAGLVWRVK